MKLSALLLIALLSLFVFTANCQVIISTVQSTNNDIVFASDTQAPIWIESLWLHPNHNRAATKKIFKNITEKQPTAVFLLGDVVSVGCSNKQWKRMDVFLKRLREKEVAVSATLGNHDLMFKAKKGQRKFVERFPNYVNTGFVDVRDSVAVILLNSNYKFLTPDQDSMQLNWYRSTLNKLDDDSAIQFVITGCHHSPFTNTKFAGISNEVRQKFVGLFLKSKKSRLFLSGHTHAYEHFKVEGKDFLVIGGGGGLHEELKNNKRLTDIDSTYKPMYHYLTVNRHADKLEVKSVRLKADFSGFEEGARFSIDKPAANGPVEKNAGYTAGLVSGWVDQ